MIVKIKVFDVFVPQQLAKYQNPRYLVKFCMSILPKVTEQDNEDFDPWPRYTSCHDNRFKFCRLTF